MSFKEQDMPKAIFSCEALALPAAASLNSNSLEHSKQRKNGQRVSRAADKS